jgi:hypothetical protein
VGATIIVETGNHLQSVAVLDLFVRDGSYAFADASGLERARQREELVRRIDDLRVRISNWERDGKVPAADLQARRNDLAKLQQELAGYDVKPPPTHGSFFRYTVKEITQSLGADTGIQGDMAAYYKLVNERNRVAFANRAPPAAAPDQPVYVGIDACTKCHAAARKVWDATKHAHAYETLATQFKQFNLDCVSCHVTGYEQPGGSTVTHVDTPNLKDVECEVCHGPGSKHAADTKTSMPFATPRPSKCLDCHHSPHVEDFDPAAKMGEILGPGHGQPAR